MDDLTRLLAIDAIRQLKARYFRCLDTKDWDGWLSVFTEDATLEFDLAVSTGGRSGEAAPKLVGKATIAQFVPRDLATARTIHHGHTAEIELLDETHARGVWAMDDVVDHGHTVLRGAGHYRETYLKTQDGWRIASIHLTRIHLEQETRGRIVLPGADPH